MPTSLDLLDECRKRLAAADLHRKRYRLEGKPDDWHRRMEQQLDLAIIIARDAIMHGLLTEDDAGALFDAFDMADECLFNPKDLGFEVVAVFAERHLGCNR